MKITLIYWLGKLHEKAIKTQLQCCSSGRRETVLRFFRNCCQEMKWKFYFFIFLLSCLDLVRSWFGTLFGGIWIFSGNPPLPSNTLPRQRLIAVGACRQLIEFLERLEPTEKLIIIKSGNANGLRQNWLPHPLIFAVTARNRWKGSANESRSISLSGLKAAIVPQMETQMKTQMKCQIAWIDAKDVWGWWWLDYSKLPFLHRPSFTQFSPQHPTHNQNGNQSQRQRAVRGFAGSVWGFPRISYSLPSIRRLLQTAVK